MCEPLETALRGTVNGFCSQNCSENGDEGGKDLGSSICVQDEAGVAIAREKDVLCFKAYSSTSAHPSA
jgi:hypothetical protein